MSNPAECVGRLDEFPDASGRFLVTLTAQGQTDTETWPPLDLNGNVAQQHLDMSRRLQRFFKVRTRHLLNGLAMATLWQQHVAKLRAGLLAEGYEPERMSFDGLSRSLLNLDLSGFPDLVELARITGFLDAAEVTALLRGEAINVALDPRPGDVPLGPPLVFEEM